MSEVDSLSATMERSVLTARPFYFYTIFLNDSLEELFFNKSLVVTGSSLAFAAGARFAAK
jgi:hypothetical protein